MRSLIHHLCVMTLGGWEPEAPFVLFDALVDESDTHGKRPNMTMSALLSTAGRWERGRRDYKALRNRLGFETFHGTDFRAASGEFSEWDYPTWLDCAMSMGRLVATHVAEVFTVHCPYDVFEEHFLKKPRPRRMPSLSQYGVCFSVLLDSLTNYVWRQGQGTNHRLSLIVEDGHRNAGSSGVLFKARKDLLEGSGSNTFRTHTLASKADEPLLQLADMTATGHTLEQREIRKGTVLPFGERDIAPFEGLETGWSVFEVSPDYLGLLISQFEENQAAKQEEWLRRRQAWLAEHVAQNGQPV